MPSGAHISIHILDMFGPTLARLGDMFNGKNPRLPSAGPPFRKVTCLFAKPKPTETCPIFHGTQELGMETPFFSGSNLWLNANARFAKVAAGTSAVRTWKNHWNNKLAIDAMAI